MGRGLSPPWESGIWLGRRWGATSHIVAASPTEVREVRAAARRPWVEHQSREERQNLRAAPRAWRAGSASSGGGLPQ
eukprot:15482325-Alexandrium_andersonii.AAC.1